MRRLMTIVATLGCALTLAACVGGNDQKADRSDATQTAGSEAPTAPQRTASPAQPPAPAAIPVAQCTAAGLAADHRTLTQARSLQVGAEVTINGTKQRLAAGQSYWSLCSGPSLEERLAIVTAARDRALANLITRTEERNAARAQVRELRPLVYVDPAAGNTADNTWKHRAQQNAGIDWLKWAFLAIAIVSVAGWVFTARRRRAPHQIGASGHREPRHAGIDPDDGGTPAFQP